MTYLGWLWILLVIFSILIHVLITFKIYIWNTKALKSLTQFDVSIKARKEEKSFISYLWICYPLHSKVFTRANPNNFSPIKTSRPYRGDICLYNDFVYFSPFNLWRGAAVRWNSCWRGPLRPALKSSFILLKQCLVLMQTSSSRHLNLWYTNCCVYMLKSFTLLN